MEILKLTAKQMLALPDFVGKKITGRYILRVDGHTYFGFHTAKQVQKALKQQKVEPYLNLNQTKL